jgi:prepilin peptidase CpaA
MFMTLTAYHLATLLLATALLLTAAVNDSRRYKIPNIICASLVLLFPLYVLTAPRSIEWEQNMVVSILVLVSGFGMFLGNLAGAGDIKLLAATSLWAGPHLIAVFVVTTAISGGLLALTIAAMTHLRNRRKNEAIPLAKVPIPYGIAIAFGGLSTFYMLSQSILFPG